jgi:Collagen triple helix repeat (20 copies)
MQKRIVTTKLVRLSLAVLLTFTLASAVRAQSFTPTVTSATVNLTAGTITIDGSGFSEFFSGPSVNLDGVNLTIQSFTNQTIVASLGSVTTPGTYLLKVTVFLTTAQFDVTIGAVGPQGPQGPQGLQGPAGLTGPQGLPGSQGPAGAMGATGLQGPAGPIGLTGATGPVGPQGALGPAGPPGPVGTIGLTGATGAAGPQGPAGTQGPTGPQGAQGPVGSVAMLARMLTIPGTSTQTTSYGAPVGLSTANATESNVYMLSPNATVTASNLAVVVTVVVNNNSGRSFTLRLNGVDTALSCIIESLQTSCASNVAVTIPPLSLISIHSGLAASFNADGTDALIAFQLSQ